MKLSSEIAIPGLTRTLFSLRARGVRSPLASAELLGGW